MKKGRLTPTLFRYVENLLILALLIGNGAGRLAGRLARSLALAAAALGGTGLQSGPVEGLDMLHWYLLLNRLVQQLYHSFSLDASPAVPLAEN